MGLGTKDLRDGDHDRRGGRWVIQYHPGKVHALHQVLHLVDSRGDTDVFRIGFTVDPIVQDVLDVLGIPPHRIVPRDLFVRVPWRISCGDRIVRIRVFEIDLDEVRIALLGSREFRSLILLPFHQHQFADGDILIPQNIDEVVIDFIGGLLLYQLDDVDRQLPSHIGGQHQFVRDTVHRENHI